jgi:hypothetical protein
MPFSNPQDAVDAMMSQFKTAWDAQSGTVPPVIYDDNLDDKPPTGEWVRVMAQHNISRATVIGNTRFRRGGLLTIVIYAVPGDGGVRRRALGLVALHAVQGKNSAPDGVWYRNAAYRDAGQEGEWSKGIVQANFEYDEALPRPGLP